MTVDDVDVAQVGFPDHVKKITQQRRGAEDRFDSDVPEHPHELAPGQPQTGGLRAARRRPRVALNPAIFIGPKLKIERAKGHILDLETAIKAFLNTNPYGLAREVDPQTGENVYRVLVKESVPITLSGIIGDAVHNLRSVLDYLACDLIRANGQSNAEHGGLPIRERSKRLKAGTVSKIKGVSAKAERLILRLKGCNGWNTPMFRLNMLDVFDKHNCIVPVAAATVQITAKVGVPGMFVGPEGTIRLLGPGPGGKPLMTDAGVPAQFRRVFPIENNIEIYRSPMGFNEEVQVAVG